MIESYLNNAGEGGDVDIDLLEKSPSFVQAQAQALAQYSAPLNISSDGSLANISQTLVSQEKQRQQASQKMTGSSGVNASVARATTEDLIIGEAD
ncbi:MAG: hypothetical protein AAFX99_30050 [Myxococcota bacterium]